MNNNRNNNNNRRRGRGNNNRQQGGQQLNRIDSRARGNAPQMLEKYRKLAHDSHLNGDRVTEEYYLQFADHYFRVIADQRVRQEEQRQPRPNDRPAEYGDDYAEDDFYADPNSPYDRAGNYAPSMQNGGQGGQQNAHQNVQGGAGQNNAGQNNGTQNSSGQNNGQQGGQGYAQNGNVQGDNRGEGRNERGDRSRRNDRGDRQERGDRQDRPERQERGERQDRRERAEPEAPAFEGPAVEAQQPGEAEASVYEPSENPFVRESRPARAPRARKPRRDAAGDTEAAAPVDGSASFDPASLPPAISRRTEEPAADNAAPVVTRDAAAEEAPAKPKRRTRRTAPPADDAAGALPETVN